MSPRKWLILTLLSETLPLTPSHFVTLCLVPMLVTYLRMDALTLTFCDCLPWLRWNLIPLVVAVALTTDGGARQ